MTPLWTTYCGDILDVPADVLVCSANVYLNLSGGVGGAFLLRYGDEMQRALHTYLAERGLRHVPRGTVVVMPPCGGPYRAVLHAAAVNGMYESSAEVVAETLAESLRRAAGLGGRTVALAALATGYGRLSISEFADALTHVARLEFPGLQQVVLAMRSADDLEELHRLVPALHATGISAGASAAPPSAREGV